MIHHLSHSVAMEQTHTPAGISPPGEVTSSHAIQGDYYRKLYLKNDCPIIWSLCQGLIPCDYFFCKIFALYRQRHIGKTKIYSQIIVLDIYPFGLLSVDSELCVYMASHTNGLFPGFYVKNHNLLLFL